MKLSRRWAWLLLALACVGIPLSRAPAADRGIGGTGLPDRGPVISDRGIGGTGIVGVVTGFGSVFVNGLEVAYTSATPLTVDGEPDPDVALKVGQLATIIASEDKGLRAVSIDLRHEVSGPVTSVTPPAAGPDGTNSNAGTLVVAGQNVTIDSATEGERTVQTGDWVAVSGLRAPDGVIAATRIDRRVPGPILVRGTAVRGAGGWRVGDLALQPPNSANFAPGANVTVRGAMVNGALAGATVDPDVLSSDPAAFFGSRVRRMVIESYVSAAGGHVRLEPGWHAAPGRGVTLPAGSHRAIVRFERGAHGDFIATHYFRRPTYPRGGDRPGAPRRGDRHGALEPPRFGPRPFGPERHETHAWRERRPEFGRGGFMPRRFGCEGCRRGRGPP